MNVAVLYQCLGNEGMRVVIVVNEIKYRCEWTKLLTITMFAPVIRPVTLWISWGLCRSAINAFTTACPSSAK